MKKINQSVRKKFPPVRLYLDDLEKITNILGEEGFKKIEIITETHQYNQSELAKIPKANPIQQIKSNHPFYISIDFNDGREYIEGGSIYSGKDSALAEGLIKKIENVILKRKRRIFSLFGSGRFMISLVFLIGISIRILSFKALIEEPTKDRMGTGLLIIILLAYLIASGILFKRNIFYYRKKEDQLSFWGRNKEKILVSIFIVIITSMITIPATIFLTNLWGKQ